MAFVVDTLLRIGIVLGIASLVGMLLTVMMCARW